MTVRANTASTRHIPIVDLGAEYRSLKKELDPVLERVFSSGSYILGEETEHFEKELAAYCQVRSAVGVNSGTDAILMALRAADIGPGDEVIVPAMTFVGTVEPIVQLGARPVFADIDPVTYTLSPDQARKKITKNTKAMIAVHLYGQTADLKPLVELAQANRFTLIEDMAQAIGCDYQGKRAGGFGRLACLSFFPTKNLGACGDGGAVLTSDETLAARVRRLRNHGASVKYQHEEIAYNSRLDEIQSAILRVKLHHLDEWNRQRMELAGKYNRLLARLPLGLPVCGPDRSHIYHLYCVKTPRRDALRKHLVDQQIATGLHYPVPLHLQPALKDLGGKVGDYPVSESLAQEVISLPLYPQMTPGDLERVVEAIQQFFNAST